MRLLVGAAEEAEEEERKVKYWHFLLLLLPDVAYLDVLSDMHAWRYRGTQLPVVP